MEVRPGQHSSTIAQAMAHNTSTIERDLDMFEELLTARGAHELLAQVRHAHDHLKAAYAGLLSVFGQEVARVAHGGSHDEVSGERSLISVAHHDAKLARKYETR